MTETVKDWFEENCRTTGNNKIVCQRENGEVQAIDPLDQMDMEREASSENIDQFIEKNQAVGL